MLNPLVSIIMAAFNSEVYISESIKSVVDQSYSNWELLIINDGSSDNTLNVSKSFSDSRIRIFDQKNMGVSAARNVGLINMTGQYLCFLDADDVMPKNSIKSRMNIFHQYPDISFIDGIVIYMNDDMFIATTKIIIK